MINKHNANFLQMKSINQTLDKCDFIVMQDFKYYPLVNLIIRIKTIGFGCSRPSLLEMITILY